MPVNPGEMAGRGSIYAVMKDDSPIGPLLIVGTAVLELLENTEIFEEALHKNVNLIKESL